MHEWNSNHHTYTSGHLTTDWLTAIRLTSWNKCAALQNHAFDPIGDVDQLHTYSRIFARKQANQAERAHVAETNINAMYGIAMWNWYMYCKSSACIPLDDQNSEEGDYVVCTRTFITVCTWQINLIVWSPFGHTHVAVHYARLLVCT